MSIFAGPKIVDEGLIFSIDATNKKFISPLGNNSFNGAAEIIRSTVPGITVNSFNGVSLGNLNYYTVFAIDYPESSYGGDAVNRHGMTPGLNVRSGTKLYGGYRALHMWVWNNDTSSWLPTSFFNGAHLSGHCYDNWQGAEVGFATELTKFVQDYNNIKNIFKNCTFVLMGSHRADRYNAASREVLYDLGLPIGTVLDSDTPSAPEWILVGKPGLGAGNAYGWVYQNYTTDPTRVAHLNFALPVYGNKDNYLSFDGVNDYIGTNISTINTNATYSVWVNRTASVNDYNMIMGQYLPYFAIRSDGRVHFSMDVNGQKNIYTDTNSIENNKWYYLTFVHNFNGTSTDASTYINGELKVTQSFTGSQNTNTGRNFILSGWRSDNPNSYPFYGKISQVLIHNKALTSEEIKQNFEATRGRYGI
jgi:hypothetical protein